MKPSKFLKSAAAIITAIGCMNASYGQDLALLPDQQPAGKINVQLKITPTYPGFQAGIRQMDEKEKVHLWVYNKEERRVNIRLTSDNNVLWSFNSREAYLSRILNLSALDDGIYFVEIDNGETKIEKKLFLKTREKVEKDIQIN